MSNFTTLTRLVTAGAFLIPVALAPAQDSQPASAPAAAPASVPAATVYTIEADESELTWVGRKQTGQHDGGFRSFSGTVSMAGTDLSTLALDVTIDATSLWADNERLTNHLKSADFFEVETYPTARFVSTSVQVEDEYNALVTGDLTLHGQTAPLAIPLTVIPEMEEEGEEPHIHLTSNFTLMRLTWGISYVGRPGDEIINEVAVSFNGEAEIAGHDEDEHDHEGAEDHAGDDDSHEGHDQEGHDEHAGHDHD